MRFSSSPYGILFCAGLLSAPAAACEDWKVSSGEDALLFPDTHATYISYKFIHEPAVALRVTAQFAHARFQSLTLYDDETGALVDKLEDVRIDPDPGSVNPFQPGVERSSPNRDYTVWIAASGTPYTAETNVLEVPPGPQYLTLTVRFYLPDDGQDALGGAGYPAVDAVDAFGVDPVDCPALHSMWYRSTSEESETPALQTPIHFFRLAGSQFYPSYDTAYLGTPLDPALGNVAVLRFTPPTFPETSSGTGAFSGDEEMRYWSLCLGRKETTTTVACVADQEAARAADGFIYVVLARPQGRAAPVATAAGMNVLPWPASAREPVLAYRNMVIHPEFAYGANAVPVYDPLYPPEEQAADLFIGSYAPVGTHCSERQFLRDYCGMMPTAFRRRYRR